jgi:RecB family exonuclease
LPQQFTFAEVLELLLTQIEMEPIAPPELPNAVELIGWLEMAMDDAPVAIATGMNDGVVPSYTNSDIFLPDALRKELGVMDNRRRCARDAYSLTVLLETRKQCGEVLLIAGRRSTEGNPMLPSRFFFIAKDTEKTARRVREFFAEMKPDAAVRLKRSLQPGHESEHDFHIPVLPDLPEPIKGFSVTELTQYRRCPYRYYLNRLRGFRKKDDSVDEIPQNDFGTLVHRILQRFGEKESPVRDSVSSKAIRAFLDAQLREYSEQMYGSLPRATLAIQVERARARLHVFADWQADWRRQGYEISDVEFSLDKDHPVTMADKVLSGRIDRIDRHSKNREVVVIDYKTGKADPNEAYHSKNEEWSDFQLPLYYYILRRSGYASAEETIRLCYLPIPADTQELIPNWAKWSPDVIQSGIDQAEEVIREILAKDWKTVRPNDLPFLEQKWDDFAFLCMSGLR